MDERGETLRRQPDRPLRSPYALWEAWLPCPCAAAHLRGGRALQEDQLVIRLVGEYGPRNWSKIAEHLPGRIGKQCRERWHNNLNPELKKGPWVRSLTAGRCLERLRV